MTHNAVATLVSLMAGTHGSPTLLERIARGDQDAVRDVVDLYGGLIWSLALQFTGSESDAEEAVQEVFVLLWRKAGKYDRSMGSEVTFVSVLTRRLLIDRWRRAAVRPRASGDLEPLPDRTRTEPTAFADEVAAAARALGGLDEEHRTALRLSIERGFSHSEIAEITGAPLGTVKSRIRNGLRRLRETIEGRPAVHGGRP